MFETFRRNSAAERLLEEQLFDQVVNELANGQRRNGLWAKALANSDGVEEKAKALYIQYRVQSIKDEVEIGKALDEENEKRIIENELRVIENLIKSLVALGCKVRDKGAKWHIVDSFGGRITVDNLDDLKATEEFMRRVFHAIASLKSNGYKVVQMSDGWVIKKFFEGSRKVGSVEDLEKYARSKLLP